MIKSRRTEKLLTVIKVEGCLVTVKCECGNTREFNKGHWESGKHKTCGWCYPRPKTSYPEDSTLRSAIHRCHAPHAAGYKDYGGRGIRVCPQWHGYLGLKRFLEDVGPRPGSEYSLDRIDNNGDYTPENCRWVTRKENLANRMRPEYETAMKGYRDRIDVLCKNYPRDVEVWSCWIDRNSPHSDNPVPTTYEVSTFGRIRRRNKNSNKVGNNFYYFNDNRIILTCYDKSKRYQVKYYRQRMVYSAFHAKIIEDLDFICHFDDDTSNNVLWNLIEGDFQDNMTMNCYNNAV